jgi:hypothetical protein
MQCEITGCPLPAGRPLHRPGGSSVLVVCSSCAEDLVGVFGYDVARTAPRLEPAGV